MTQKSAAYVVGLMMALMTFPVAYAQQDKAKLKVGALVPLSGDLMLLGEDLKRGMELAKDELMIENKDLASRIELIPRDDQSIPRKAEEIAKDMIANRQADILIGPILGSTTISVFRAIESTQKPLLTATVTDLLTTRLGEQVFRSCNVDTLQGRALADFASKDLKKTKAVILIDDSSEYAKNIATTFEQQFKGQGGTIAGRVTYHSGTLDFHSVINQLRKLRPQVVLLPGYYWDVGRIIEQSKQSGTRATFLGTDWWDSPKLYDYGSKEALRGHYFISHFAPDDPDPAVRDFVQKYQAKYSQRPSMYAAMGFDAVHLIADAFKRARSNLPAAMIRALATSQNVRSLMGPLNINVTRDAQKSFVLLNTTAQGSIFKARLRMAAYDANSLGVP